MGKVVRERTGLPHASWAPSVVDGDVISFPTEEEAEYPAGFCEVGAEGILDWAVSRDLGSVKCVHLVTEVFSDARAPLTRAVEAAGVARGLGTRSSR